MLGSSSYSSASLVTLQSEIDHYRAFAKKQYSGISSSKDMGNSVGSDNSGSRFASSSDKTLHHRHESSRTGGTSSESKSIGGSSGSSSSDTKSSSDNSNNEANNSANNNNKNNHQATNDGSNKGAHNNLLAVVDPTKIVKGEQQGTGRIVSSDETVSLPPPQLPPATCEQGSTCPLISKT
jgi:hypothetical protein